MPVSHVDKLIADDTNGVNLKAYRAYIPLYLLANYLDIDDLCWDALDRLHAANRAVAPSLQRLALQDENNTRDFILPETLKTGFVDCANLAYNASGIKDAAVPSELKAVFVEFMNFATYKILDYLLDDIVSVAPRLLADALGKRGEDADWFVSADPVMVAEEARCDVELAAEMRMIPGPKSWNTYCRYCLVNPLSGVSQSQACERADSKYGPLADESVRWYWGILEATRTADRGSNFWLEGDCCYYCSKGEGHYWKYGDEGFSET